MKHSSVLKLDSPIEFIESTKVSPFISKVLIKVCYVGDEPNRNHSVITKDVAREMAPSLRGCPIVGFYNDYKEDYEEHNRQIDISNGEWKITDTTKPYGFVDLNAKIWFATYLDDGEVEREYLCTEGYIWSNAYPESKRILTDGNNQSMELDEDTLKGSWTEDENGFYEFFIINEALISKLCILGEENEPCFEGAQISSFSLKIDDSFQEKMYAMMSEIKELLKEGGVKVFQTDENVTVDENVVEEVVEETPTAETTEEETQTSYSLDEIPEYTQLLSEFTELQNNFAALQASAEESTATINKLNEQLNELQNFRAEVERNEKQELINSFYMLSEDDKQDVVANIDSYSYDEIEAKLSVICVRNKVSFAADEDKNEDVTTYTLGDASETNTTPAWVKAVLETSKAMNN